MFMNKKAGAIAGVLLLSAYWFNWMIGGIPTGLAQGDESVKTVYLTFDDGPSDRVTPKILQILQQEDVPATFFIIGQQAEIRPYLIKQELAQGHSVALHSYSHNYPQIYRSTTSLLQDINKCNDVLYTITGTYSAIYRFPGGSFGLNAELIQAVENRGFTHVDWNASCRDAELYNPTAWELFCATKQTSQKHKHVVLLLHDSTTRTTTAEALPDIIHYFKEQGFTFAKFS